MGGWGVGSKGKASTVYAAGNGRIKANLLHALNSQSTDLLSSTHSYSYFKQFNGGSNFLCNRCNLNALKKETIQHLRKF